MFLGSQLIDVALTTQEGPGMARLADEKRLVSQFTEKAQPEDGAVVPHNWAPQRARIHGVHKISSNNHRLGDLSLAMAYTTLTGKPA